MKRARPLQESNCQPRATRSTTADVKNDVKAAIRTTFGAKITANADVLQKENEKRAIAATQKRALETRERSLKAGLDRVGPNTPIGKISARIKRVKSEASVPSIKPVQTLSDAELDGILATAVVEVKQMYAQRGITAARKYMDAFPTRMGMSGCRNKLSYWAACIDLERDAKEWDRVAELFERARVNVSCAEEQHSLQTLFESFEHEADEMFEEERQRLDESILDTLSDSEDLVSVMAGRTCTNVAPKSVTVPVPKVLHFLEEDKSDLKQSANSKEGKSKPRMRF